MTSLRHLLLTSLAAISLTAMAQKKQFVLDNLIPGGSTYYFTSYPENRYYEWWGDKCVELGVEELKLVDPKTGESKTFITEKEISEILKKGGRSTIFNMQRVSFPDPDKPYIFIQTGKERKTIIDFEKKTIVWSEDFDYRTDNVDVNTKSMNIAYTIGYNLFVRLANGEDKRLSDDGSIDNVYGQSVHRDEFGIHKGTYWSPLGNKLAFYRMDQSMVSKYPQVNITPYDDSQCYQGKDSAEINSRCATIEPDPYPMAGETSHKVWVGIYDVAKDKTIYLDTGDPTDRYFTNIAWSIDETKLYLIELNRDQNHGSLDEYDALTGKKIRTLFTEDNEKYFEPCNPIEFLPWDKNKFIYQTRFDGYNHIYLLDLTRMEGKPFAKTPSRQLTKGNYEVISVLGFNTATKSIIYTSNAISPLQQNVFSVGVNGKSTPLGNTTGWHTAQLSTNGTYFIDNYNSPDIPRCIDLVDVKGNTLNLHKATDPWADYDVPEIKTGTIKAADGVTDLHYRLILPTGFDPSKKYPAVVYVYGGPHAHVVDASRAWGARGWDIYMAQKGYVMFSLDNRGSEHRGLAFEQATFRNLGVEEVKDQLLGAKFLQSLPYVDSNRLGVHGWSFGGFMTTSLMCEPNTPFKVGVAGGPVIDWRFYEVMYGERYMDTPQSNPEGYANTSLLNKPNFQGRLMIIYGGNDPTCVPQHTLSFVRACIDANAYPDLFVYPGDGHNMFGSDRVHLHEVITRYFEDHLK